MITPICCWNRFIHLPRTRGAELPTISTRLQARRSADDFLRMSCDDCPDMMGSS